MYQLFQLYIKTKRSLKFIKDIKVWVFYISSLFTTENIIIEPIDQYNKYLYILI